MLLLLLLVFDTARVVVHIVDVLEQIVTNLQVTQHFVISQLNLWLAIHRQVQVVQYGGWCLRLTNLLELHVEFFELRVLRAHITRKILHLVTRRHSLTKLLLTLLRWLDQVLGRRISVRLSALHIVIDSLGRRF